MFVLLTLVVGITMGACPTGMWGQSATVGYVGTDCTLPCGNCASSTTCDITTGVCPSGCADGWTGDKCTTAKCDNNCGGDKNECVAPNVCRCTKKYTRVFGENGEISCSSQAATGMIGFASSLAILTIVLIFFTYFNEIWAALGFEKIKPE